MNKRVTNQQKSTFASIFKFTAFLVVIFVMFLGIMPGTVRATGVANYVQITRVQGVPSFVPGTLCVIANQGARYHIYDISATNPTSHDTYQFDAAIFHSNTSGCATTVENPGLQGGSVSGKTSYAPGESGSLVATFDTSAFSCGRVQYDMGFTPHGQAGIASGNYNNMFYGIVVDYGVNCGGTTTTTQTTGTITVVKEIINDNGGTMSVSGFELFINNNRVTSGQSNTLPAGNYTIRENQKSGYTGSIRGACDGDGTVTLQAGQNLTCVVLNNDVAGTTTTQTPTCQDPSATNYRGALPCTYPAPTCQDPYALNYRGALPCTYAAPTCQDPSATNYRGALPCTYPAPTCQDPYAQNYRGALPCTYAGPTCQDPSATNYRGSLPCTYPVNTNSNTTNTNTNTNTNTSNPVITNTNTNTINFPAYPTPPTYPTYYPPIPTYPTYPTTTYYPPIQNPIVPVYNNQPTVVLSADSTNIAYNGTTFLRWYTTNATSCFASGGSVGWAGTKNIGPGSFYTGSLTASRTYSITCNNSYGSASDSTTVTVRGLVTTTVTTARPAATSLVLITSSVDRNQPIVPTLDNTR